MFGIGNYGYGQPWDRQQAAAAPGEVPAAADPTAAPTAAATAAPGAPPGGSRQLPPMPRFNPGGFQGDFQNGSFNLPGFSTTGSAPGTAWSFGGMNGNMPGRGGGGNVSWGGGPTPMPAPDSGAAPGLPAGPGGPADGAPGATPGGPPRWGGMMNGMFQPPSGAAAGGGGFGATFPRIGQLFPGAGGRGEQGGHRGLLGGLFGGNRPSGGIAGGPGQGQGQGQGRGRGGFHMPLQGAGFWNPRGNSQGGAGARRATPGTSAAGAKTGGAAQSIAAGEPNPSKPVNDGDGDEPEMDTREEEDKEGV